MDLHTRYLGLDLPHPFVVGACPLSDDIDMVRRLEDAGAAALVMRSLFQEQVTEETRTPREPSPSDPTEISGPRGPDPYLEQIRRLKAAVDLPIVASLNGTTPGRWLECARLVEEAGADAIEVDFYFVATDPRDGADVVEERVLEMVRMVLADVQIPVAVKLSPFFTALASFARRLDRIGIRGLALFNRFYQPDIDPHELRIAPTLQLSESSELLLRLRWLAILCDRIVAPLAVTGGVHDAQDAVKAIMAGASAVQVVSAILRDGPERIGQLRRDVVDWMRARDYESLGQMRGQMSLLRCRDPQEFERVNYLRVLQGWSGAPG
ncbi:MAG: dihydroorotate dehydrogenase-like protein [Gemmatimonadetes bacterium]|nr:dihydroorotate dehydrogenase-like protein [Gemmatimonadota bacterium]